MATIYRVVCCVDEHFDGDPSGSRGSFSTRAAARRKIIDLVSKDRKEFPDYEWDNNGCDDLWWYEIEKDTLDG